MNQHELTSKGQAILTHFLSSGEDYKAYPAKIEKDMRNRVSRVTANKICKQFVDLGIFGFKMIRPPRQKNETEHYYLKHDINGFIELAELVLVSESYYGAGWFVFNHYTEKRLDGELVKHILADRGVTIPRKFFPGDKLKRKDSEENFELGEKIININLPVFAEDIPHEAIIAQICKFNKHLKPETIRHDLTLEIKDHYEHWLEERIILPIQVLIQISNTALREFLFGNELLFHAKKDQLELLVNPATMTEIFERKKIPLSNRAKISQISEGIWRVTDGTIRYRIIDHGDFVRVYGGWRAEKLGDHFFKPTGKALYEFGDLVIQPLLFSLLFKAIAEYADCRTAETPGIVDWIAVRQEHKTEDEKDALLIAHLKDFRTLYIDGGFQSTTTYIGDDFLIPETLWVKTWIKEKQVYSYEKDSTV